MRFDYYVMIFLLVNCHTYATRENSLTNRYVRDLDGLRLDDDLGDDQDDLGCRGNRTLAVKHGRKCSRRCRSDMPCENVRKQCICDGLCGLSCIKPDLVCPELSKIQNGNFYPQATLFNTKVKYQCDPGFYLHGSIERVCLGDREWSGTNPECNREPLCRRPPHVNNAINSKQDLYRPQDTFEYACLPGHKSIGAKRVECKLVDRFNATSWVWEGEPLECKPNRCEDLARPIKNGRYMLTSIDHGSKAYIRCLDGFKLVGQNITQCVKGNWTQTNSSCVEVHCKYPGAIENGRVMLVGLTGMHVYKDYIRRIANNRQITYECDSSYRMSDGAPSGATCVDGQWKPEGLPFCIRE